MTTVGESRIAENKEHAQRGAEAEWEPWCEACNQAPDACICNAAQLEASARHWTGVALDLDFDMFTYTMFGSDLLWHEEWALRRLERISQLLGREAVKAIVAEVKAQLVAKVPPSLWAAYEQSDTAARDAMLPAAYAAAVEHQECDCPVHAALAADAEDGEHAECVADASDEHHCKEVT